MRLSSGQVKFLTVVGFMVGALGYATFHFNDAANMSRGAERAAVAQAETVRQEAAARRASGLNSDRDRSTALNVVTAKIDQVVSELGAILVGATLDPTPQPVNKGSAGPRTWAVSTLTLTIQGQTGQVYEALKRVALLDEPILIQEVQMNQMVGGQGNQTVGITAIVKIGVLAEGNIR